jgi:hypothetical protein
MAEIKHRTSNNALEFEASPLFLHENNLVALRLAPNQFAANDQQEPLHYKSQSASLVPCRTQQFSIMIISRACHLVT